MNGIPGGTNIEQVGQSLNGDASKDFFGRSVALSADGSIVAAGASGNDDNGDDSGHVRVFSLQLEK